MSGTRRIAVAHGPGGWTVAERWTSRGLKPYFNDFVVHEGHAFGFDASILACIDLEDGTRKWKGGRYGNGQLVLLPDQDLLLVLSEEGELALVERDPGPVHGARAVPGNRGQDLESPGAGRRCPAGSQRRGDGCVPSVSRGSVKGWSRATAFPRCPRRPRRPRPKNTKNLIGLRELRELHELRAWIVIGTNEEVVRIRRPLQCEFEDCPTASNQRGGQRSVRLSCPRRRADTLRGRPDPGISASSPERCQPDPSA